MTNYVPLWARNAKHTVFSLLPGRIGLRNRACLHHLQKGSQEEAFQRALDDVKPGEICIDCGANVGSVAQKFVAKDAKVYAFEPDPWSFAQLEARLGHSTNLRLFNQAVGTESSTGTLFRDSDFMEAPGHFSLASSTISRPDRPQQEVKIEVINFLDFLRNLKSEVAILKMDIEGAEVSILEQLFKTGLVIKFRHVFVETHELQFPDLLERTWALRAQAAAIEGVAVNLDWH